MNNDVTKLHLQQQHQTEETASHQHAQQHQAGREFATVEEMIRTDREQTEVPPEIARHLNESLAREPKQGQPWWKRIFK